MIVDRWVLVWFDFLILSFWIFWLVGFFFKYWPNSLGDDDLTKKKLKFRKESNEFVLFSRFMTYYV